ncbi:uncharacterized protein LOC134803573 [Cydia splendana]|uniref:uncharacterized protein LOC134803573 n=1 Tax=Cydia splendana TaxID=1100963 RepID=UPI00300CD50B
MSLVLIVASSKDWTCIESCFCSCFWNFRSCNISTTPGDGYRLPLKTGPALNPASAPVSGTSGVATSALPLATATAYTGPFVSVTSTSGVDNLPVHILHHLPLPLKTGPALNPASAPVSGTSGVATSAAQAQKIKKLEAKCDLLRKKVKKLNEKVRQQRKKIAEFQNIIKDLQERNLVNNENSIVLEACVGPKDFLKRQILKSEGLPLEKQYSEETRKFAHTLHCISPKAYNFVRQTYNTCLPHPRTLIRWNQKINAEPGLCDEAFAALQNKVQASDTPIVP